MLVGADMVARWLYGFNLNNAVLALFVPRTMWVLNRKLKCRVFNIEIARLFVIGADQDATYTDLQSREKPGDECAYYYKYCIIYQKEREGK